MTKRNLYLILVVGIVLLAAILIYNAVSSKPGASNFYMSNDKAGEHPTTVFSPGEHIYVFFDVKGIEKDTKFESRWYALELEGQDPDTPLRTIEYIYTGDEDKIYFDLWPVTVWPAGAYKVEVYMDGTKLNEQTFNLQ